jgi:hypothetical protein
VSIDGNPKVPCEAEPAPNAAVDLFWIPLGAGIGVGARVVRSSGRLFEWAGARVQRRRACPLYHSALEVTVPAGRFVLEMTPVPDAEGQRRGVVAEGPVGVRWARGLRTFRYEIRRWNGGVIPDAAEAVQSPLMVSDDLAIAERLLALAPAVPTPVWGRDELMAGEMWNSNSVTSWLLSSSGVDTTGMVPPLGGRAPGWGAGTTIASRRGVRG